MGEVSKIEIFGDKHKRGEEGEIFPSERDRHA